MESAAIAFLQSSPLALLPLSSPSPFFSGLHCSSLSRRRNIRPNYVQRNFNGGAIHPPPPSYLACGRSPVKIYGGQVSCGSTPDIIRRASSVRKRGPRKSFALPSDVELEEAEAKAQVEGETEAQGVTNGSAKLVARTDGEDAEEGIQQVAVDVFNNSVWRNFPPRYKLMVTTSLAFVICNMDKVNMSVAIIPIAHQYGWNASTSGLVQSSFFWGYAISQLPGGFLAGRFSGKKVLQVGVLVWSLATALVPLTTSFVPGLLFCRLLVGLGEGVSPAAATDLIAKTMPVFERSRAVSFVFGGLNVGSVAGLLLAPAIIRFFGWEVVFYLFGILGVIWCLGFDTAATEEQGTIKSGQEKQSTTAAATEEQGTIKSGQEKQSTTAGYQNLQNAGDGLNSAHHKKTDSHAATFDTSNKATPWGAFFRDPAVWAMMYAHFCGNWGHYNLLSWFPTYFSEELNLDLTNSALVSLLPPLGSVVVAAVASSLADYLISKGVDITFVRKLCQSIAFLSPAACMLLVSFSPDLSPAVTAGILTIGSSLSTFTLAGLYCTHQDISPKYASVLLGLTNTVGAIPGIFGVALTGYILDQTKSWTLALFVPSIFFYLSGALVWNIFATSKPREF